MKWLRWIVWVAITSLSTNIYAKYDCDPELYLGEDELPYIFGVNYKQYWIEPQGDWKRLFVKNAPGFNVYFGWRFLPCWELDLGYEWTNNKPLSITIPRGTSLLGATNNTGFVITSISKVRFKSGHADLNTFLPIPYISNYFCNFEPEAIVSLGVAGVKAGMKIGMTPNTKGTNQYIGLYTPIQGRSHAVFRMGLGLQAIVVENVGIRLMWRYENTRVLRGRNSFITQKADTRVIFSNAQTLALGAFLKF